MSERSRNDAGSERIGEAVRAYYDAQRPSEEILGRLAALADPTPPRLDRRLAAVAAAAVLALAIGWFALPRADAGPLAERVAAEIAFNHEKLVEPDVRGANLPALVSSLDRLDFVPIASARLADTGLRFTGARYCSLEGQLAVQLQLEDAEGRRVTLYQTRRSERFAELADGRRQDGATEVTWWIEGDVVLGLARAVP